MNVLILGGTRFVGVHLTEALLARGHAVTHFNRGRTNAAPIDGVRTALGDRMQGFDALGSERFDAVIDTSAYVPVAVEKAAGFFAARTARYLFVSTISVYAPHEGPSEDAPRALLPEHASRAEPSQDTYGPLKALCEDVVADLLGDRATILRPGLIVGPFDPTDRFTYWPLRFARGGDVLLAGPPERPVQFVDARDLASFAVTAIERDLPGAYNVVTPRGSATMGGVARACEAAARTSCAEHYAGDEFLSSHGVTPWTELPLWLPSGGLDAGLFNVDAARAAKAGLTIRPLEDTARDVLAWGRGRTSRAWLAPEREAELVALLRGGTRAAV